MVSAIIASFTFIGKYLSLFLLKGIQPFLIEISKILIERVSVTISFNKTGPSSEDPNVLWTDWKRKVLDIVNIHPPLRTRCAITNKAPWVNSGLKKGMHDRDAAKRKAITSDWEKYKKLRNIINNNIKTSKVSYYSNAFIQSKGNPRKTWQTFNELTSRRVNNTTVKEIKLNDAIVSNSSELSNAFNDHFSTIGPRLANEIPPTANNNSFRLLQSCLG